MRAKFPLTVQYKDFGQGWRELNYGGAFYFTKGDTVWLTDEEYLVVYKFAPRTSPLLDNTEYISTVTGNTPKFTRDDRFELTLLSTRELIPLVTRGNTGVHSFDATVRRPTLDPANFSVTFNQNLSLIYLRKIFEALTSYSAAYLNVMPPMESAFAARKALLPFAENAAIFTQPGTNQPYKANPLFSNRKREHLRKSASMVVFYEAQPAPDDLRAVLLYNGAVRRVDVKTWEKLRKASLID
ncbi:MAG: hypothetical protein JO316_04325 [Abitibacteriaceae bacterium]|nr:hypothetical protein [Abditibacteriaceae bacterium]MBV9864551.1 hypothetical protein [Abditibacteriaceae bacterium]